MNNPLAEMILGNINSLPEKERLQIVAHVLKDVEGHQVQADMLRKRAKEAPVYDYETMKNGILENFTFRKPSATKT